MCFIATSGYQKIMKHLDQIGFFLKNKIKKFIWKNIDPFKSSDFFSGNRQKLISLSIAEKKNRLFWMLHNKVTYILAKPKMYVTYSYVPFYCSFSTSEKDVIKLCAKKNSLFWRIQSVFDKKINRDYSIVFIREKVGFLGFN